MALSAMAPARVLKSGVAATKSVSQPLATEAHEDGLSTRDAGENGTLGGLVVTTLGERGLTLLTKDFDCALEVAFSFGKGVFAVHHTGAGHVTELLDIC